MEWFVSVWDSRAKLHHYRAGQVPDRASAIEQAIATGRSIARRDDGSFIGVVGRVVIDDTTVDLVPFGDLDVSDEDLRGLIGSFLPVMPH
ncbi:hypothetical protein [Rhodococcus qingshengii]|uniref:hypothetical protein n=1 Tax=Rhodococcus qingshengii TaxID=334542 RepID=UPI0036D8420E